MKLKKILPFLILISSFSHSFSQTSTIKFWAYDTYGNTDTIEFGLLPNSSIGIDTLLGENDLTGIPFDSLEIRSIQRDSLNHNCLSLGAGMNGPVYFTQNRDLKNDFRPYTGINGYMNNSFEIVIHSKSTPFYWGYDASNIGFMNNNVLDVSRDSNCHTTGVYAGLLDSTYVISGSNISGNFFLFIFESHDINGYIVNQKSLQKKKKESNIFPNPFKNQISISPPESSSENQVNIYNSLGKKVINSISITGEITLNVSNLPSGVYFIEILNVLENHSSIHKIIKSK